MTNDRYTRAVLTVIALALVADAAKGWLSIPQAYAGEPMRCEIVGEVKVGGKVAIDTFNNPVQVRPSDDFNVRIHDDVPVKVDGDVHVRNN